MSNLPYAMYDLEARAKLAEHPEDFSPRLYQITWINRSKPELPKYTWIHHQEEHGPVEDVTPLDFYAITELLKIGVLVPTFTSWYEDNKYVLKELAHFDNVKFAMGSLNRLLIYNFAKVQGNPDPHFFIPPNTNLPYVGMLQQRFAKAAAVVDTAPINLISQHPGHPPVTIYPIITDAAQLQIRARQQAYQAAPKTQPDFAGP